MRILRIGLYTALFAGTVIAPAIAAYADSLTITYYTISSNDPDANHLSGGTYTNEVQNSLGSNGLPVLNTAAYGCTSSCFTAAGPTNLLSDGEITYWGPDG